MTVADARFAKPIDAGLMAQLAAEHDLLVTVEEGVLAGGFGTAVWETLNEAGTTIPRILRVGLPDRYVTHGKPALLHEEVGFTGKRIAERVRAAILDRESATSARSAHRRRVPHVGAPRSRADRRSPLEAGPHAALTRAAGLKMKRPAGEAGRFGEEGCCCASGRSS